MNNFSYYKKGMRDGIPIGLGYFAVAFSLGIAARNVGVSAWQGFFASLGTIASAGEYAAFTAIGDGAAYLELALVMLVTNCRYLLMSCALSQRVDGKLNLWHRIGMGSLITDEIFGAAVSLDGFVPPYYIYGLAASSVLPWALGTMLGVIVGNLLPAILVTALSVTLYGMFLAIIVPPSRESKLILSLVLVSFALSFACGYIPFVRDLSSGVRVVILTVLIAGIAAVLFPEKDASAAKKGKEADAWRTTYTSISR